MSQKIKIGIFDSGLGGLTVLKSISSQFRDQVSFIYVGDLAHLPYGDKSRESIIKYSENICKFLIAQKVDMIIIACNSASSVAGNHLIKKYSNKIIIDTIKPSTINVMRHIDSQNRNNFESKLKYNLGIIGTEATINSNSYKNHIIKEFESTFKGIDLTIESVACPLFVPIVEEGWENTDVAYQIATKYISKFNNKLDSIILGCTHYPIIINTLKKVFNKLGHNNLFYIDSGLAIANYIKKIKFDQVNLNNQQGNNSLLSNEDKFYVTDNSAHFNNLASRLLDEKINYINLLSL